MHYNHSFVSHVPNGTSEQRPLFASPCYHYFIIFSDFFFISPSFAEKEMRRGWRMICIYDVIILMRKPCARFYCLIVFISNVRSTRKHFLFIFLYVVDFSFIRFAACAVVVVHTIIFLLSHTMTQWYSHVHVCMSGASSNEDFRTTRCDDVGIADVIIVAVAVMKSISIMVFDAIRMKCEERQVFARRISLPVHARALCRKEMICRNPSAMPNRPLNKSRRKTKMDCRMNAKLPSFSWYFNACVRFEHVINLHAMTLMQQRSNRNDNDDDDNNNKVKRIVSVRYASASLNRRTDAS